MPRVDFVKASKQDSGSYVYIYIYQVTINTCSTVATSLLCTRPLRTTHSLGMIRGLTCEYSERLVATADWFFGIFQCVWDPSKTLIVMLVLNEILYIYIYLEYSIFKMWLSIYTYRVYHIFERSTSCVKWSTHYMHIGYPLYAHRVLYIIPIVMVPYATRCAALLPRDRQVADQATVPPPQRFEYPERVSIYLSNYTTGRASESN